MNKVILMGNLTRDVEIRYSQNDNAMAIARFSIAVNRRYTKGSEQESDFFNCIAFGKTAEFVDKYFTLGSRILLVGRIQNDNYTNKNGEKVYSVQVLVDEVEFAEKKSSNGNSDNRSLEKDDGFMNIPEGIEDGLPFN